MATVLLGGDQSFSIIDKSSGEILDSRPSSYPHEYMVRDCLGGSATEEAVIRVITHIPSGKPRIWELRYDVDGYLRSNQFLSQQEWADIMVFAADVLLRNGAGKSDLVACDDRVLSKTYPIGELKKALAAVPKTTAK
jgi:hypothetical protein